MPTMPPKACGFPGCRELVRGRPFCVEHSREKERVRGTATQRGYNARHRHWRKKILSRDPVCVHCHDAPATEADHIVPIRAGGARFDLNNGAGLCGTCHRRKTNKERLLG